MLFKKGGILNLLVAMALSLDLAQDVYAVVVAKGSGHFVVVHGEMVLLDAPKLGQAGGVHNFEDASIAALPGNVAGIPLCRVVEKLLKEIPQEATI
jgi:hypothetical protein